MSTTTTSWGRLIKEPHQSIALSSRTQAIAEVKQNQPGICFGMGRSYGDACLNPGGILWHTEALNRLLHFDPKTGRLTCEAGVLLKDIQQLFFARGWYLPVTPGTQWVTVGGAIANDIHGKNYHRYGSFGNQIHSITLLRTDGSVHECSAHQNSELFYATIGGIGLTGVILSAELQLAPASSSWLDVETIPFTQIHEFLTLTEQSEASWEHTVSWIDCLGRSGQQRGIFMRAQFVASPPTTELSTKRPMSIPFNLPISLVNQWSLRAFNEAYFILKSRKAGKSMMHYIPFSYPLDNIAHWNRMYGPKGFYQYQCLVPRQDGELAIKAILAEIAAAGEGSFLSVLKTFSKRQALGMLSFPQDGITLALDFPNRGASTLALFNRLDAIVHAAQGRLYLAKDARMSREFFEQSYPLHQKYQTYRDPGISSAMSRRLMGY
ncbi:MAG: FAD-binding oxidoreductase [Legionella sp.]|nr:FAD-binding oxidoreductase [Legionella sp.]